jgi:hypothetical protein
LRFSDEAVQHAPEMLFDRTVRGVLGALVFAHSVGVAVLVVVDGMVVVVVLVIIVVVATAEIFVEVTEEIFVEVAEQIVSIELSGQDTPLAEQALKGLNLFEGATPDTEDQGDSCQPCNKAETFHSAFSFIQKRF